MKVTIDLPDDVFIAASQEAVLNGDFVRANSRNGWTEKERHKAVSAWLGNLVRAILADAGTNRH